MSSLSQFLVWLAALWPVVLGITVLTIALTALVVFVQLRKAKRAAADRDGRSATASVDGEAPVDVEVLPPAALPSPREIRRTVSRGFRALRDRVTNRSLRYRTPVFLLIGPEAAGKTTVLKELMPEAVVPLDPTEAAGCRWHFFDRAVTIEVDGRLLLSDVQPKASEQGWAALNRGLRFHRPERPIDGIVLTIPASELYGPKRLDGDALVLRARRIFQRLQAAQRVLGVRVPLYLVVSKCDLLPGFQDLCVSIPAENRDESVGWSNPYALETAFVPEWIDEAFDSLSHDLFEVQMELLARGHAESPDSLFQFSSTFRSMHGPLRAFTAELCRESAYQESFFFRGLYFTGDGTPDAAEHLLDGGYRESDSGASSSEASGLPPLPATLAVSREPYFLRDLFTKKIFGEAGLARSASKSRISRNRAIQAMQAAILAIVLIGGIGIWRATVVLERESGLLLTVVDDINTDLQFLDTQTALASNGGMGVGGATLQNRVFPLLSAMARVNENRLSSVFLPSSWLSSLHWDISESMRQGFTNVILPSMYAGMLAKADSLVTPPIADEAYIGGLDGGELPRYLSGIARLGRNVERYDTVSFLGSENTELENVANLVLYLFDEQLPPEFLGNERYHRIALWESYGERITARDRPTYAANVVGRAETLLRNHYDALIYRLEDINLRFESAERVQRLTSADLAEFRQLRDELAQISRVLDGSEPFWFDEAQQIGPSLAAILDSIPETVLTQRDLIRDGFEEMFYRVRQEKLQELNYRLDPFQSGAGGGIAAGSGANMALSPQLATLQAALDTLFSQPFIATAPAPAPRSPPISGSRIRWDVAGLDRALVEHSQFETFLAERQATDSPGMSRLVQGLATVQLEARIGEAVRQAMLSEPPGFAFGLRDRERDLRARIAAFQDPSRRLVQILAVTDSLGMIETYDDVAAVYVYQALEMLAEVDALLEEGGAYRPFGGSLASWEGGQPASAIAFRARDPEELDRYLAQQRTRIRFLVDTFAAPLLGGLLAPPLETFIQTTGDGTSGLVAKWRGLVEELDRYESQAGTSSVEVLEQFIREEMAAADVATCVSYSGRTVGSGSDFFLAARNRLRSQLYTRCEQLAVSRARQSYDRLSSFFDANLAGRYPFARFDAPPTAQEADPAALRQFYALFDALGPYRAVVSDPAAADFLDAMAEVREFLLPMLAADAAPGAPLFDVAVDFRTNRGDERGGDQIVDWRLSLGDAPLDYRGQGAQQSSTWRPGSVAGLSLRWALQSSERPDGAQYVSASITDRDAAFRYDGRWALLRFLQAHVAGGDDQGGYLLRFDIPTVRLVGSGAVPGDGAEVFLGLRLNHPDAGAPASMPVFPVGAPEW